MQDAGPTGGCETVGGSSCSSELSAGGDSTEMISDGRTDANCKVLVKGVGENLLPEAQAWGRPYVPTPPPEQAADDTTKTAGTTKGITCPNCSRSFAPRGFPKVRCPYCSARFHAFRQ
jgi:hypothetical protein